MHTVKKNYSASKGNGFLIFSKTCMNVESIMLSEISYKQRNILYDLTYMRRRAKVEVTRDLGTQFCKMEEENPRDGEGSWAGWWGYGNRERMGEK